MHRKSLRAMTAVTAAVAVIAFGAPTATATEDPVEATAGLIAEVAPDQGDILVGAITGGAVVTDTGSTDVAVPLDPAQPITLDSAAIDAPALAVHFPAEITVEAAQVADDGTVVYEATDNGASAAVQALDNGSVRLQTITPDANGPHEFTYTFGENIVPVEGNNGIELLQDHGDFAAVVGTVDDAWATDAEGNPVQTEYVIDGDTLIQVIDAKASTVYPIVADPKVTQTWWNTTVYFSRSETRRIADGAQVTAFVGGLVPHPVAKAIGIAAQAASIYARIFYNEGKCMKFVYYGHVANVWQPYAGAEAGRYCK